MRWVWQVLAVLALSLASASAEAPRRVALVIANSSYANAGRLENPPNDARLVAASLRQAGFSTVELKPDLGIANFRAALRDLRAKATGAEVALVYYAGHGIEANGKNWLIPVDAELNSDLDLPDEAIDLDRVMDDVRGAELRVVILDACRNNPFGRSWRAGSRAVTRGLGGVDADNVLVIYAAAPGQTASDGSGGNSPFATALARHLPEPDVAIQLLGGLVRDDVLSATSGAQRPFISASITGTPFYLVPRGGAGASASTRTAGPTAGASPPDAAPPGASPGRRTNASAPAGGRGLVADAFASFGMGDYDRDGHQDFIVRNEANGNLMLYPGEGRRVMSGQQPVQIGNGWSNTSFYGLVDYDGDGFLDIIIRTASGELKLYPGEGTRAYSHATPAQIGVGWNGFDFFGAGDWNGDGHADLVVRNGQTGDLWLYPGEGRRAMSQSPPVKIGNGWNGWDFFGMGDWNRDGRPDIVVRNQESGALWLYPNAGSNRFGPPAQIGTGWQDWDFYGMGDYDGDGWVDIAVRNKVSSELWLYPGAGGNRFGQAAKIGVGW